LDHANLYLENINFQRYLHQTVCAECGFPSCDEFIEAIRKGIKKTQDCPFITHNKAYALESIERIKELWPEVPLLPHPRPGFTGLVELNKPSPESLVLITGNNEYTEEVLMTVLGTTVCPFFVLFVNTEGNTVDMSMIYTTLTPERIHEAMKESCIDEKAGARELVIPGLASVLTEDIESLTGWRVTVGPVCAAELPLFFSEIWIPPDTI
jgi:CO dehydrogenase/acetyl-CoA synthase gamma subunit (corrinoid Fe-S protein)